MPDWKRLVRARLTLPPLHNQRSERIIEEIAGQLEDLYQEARRRKKRSARCSALAWRSGWAQPGSSEQA